MKSAHELTRIKTNEILKEGIKLLQLSDDIIPLLERYIKEIELFNPSLGLIGTSEIKDIVIKHILDSLAPLEKLLPLLRVLKLSEGQRPSVPPCETLNLKIADVGSGAGLPGIPLAIALPNHDFTLIERMERRANFLLNTKAVLGLSNINIEEKEVEKVDAKFDLITFRAFKPLEPKLLKSLYKILAPGGIIAAYKGKREKIDMEMEPLRGLCEKWEAIPVTVPFLDEERHLVVIMRH